MKSALLLLIPLLGVAFIPGLSPARSQMNAGEAMFHADAKHSGVYPSGEYGSFGALHWKFRTGGKIFSSPAICDGIAFVGSEDKKLYAIDTKTGRLKWKFSTGGAVFSSPAVYNHIVYFGSYDGFYYAVDVHSGRLVWKFGTEGEKKVGAKGLWTMKPADQYMEDLYDFFLSSPVIDKQGSVPTVYFGSSDGHLYALNAADGKLQWKFATGGIIHTSPALGNGKIYIGSWDTYFYAIDSHTGHEIWKFKTGEQPVYHVLEGIQSSAAVDPGAPDNAAGRESKAQADGTVYFGARDGNFYALDGTTGLLKWKYPADNSWVLTTPAIKDGVVYIGTSDTYLFLALDGETGKEKYRFQARGYVYSSPSLAGNTAYFGDFTGVFYAIDLESEGKLADRFVTAVSKQNAGKILNKEGKLDFGYTAANMDPALYSTNKTVMDRFYEMGSIVSTPAIAEGVIYFGSADGYLYALSLAKKPQ
ncbi:MAG TPA: PQQ-binding-like beta-propeller repeat protein [Puia sp.]